MHLPDYNYIYILDMLKYMCLYTDLSVMHLYQILSIIRICGPQHYLFR